LRLADQVNFCSKRRATSALLNLISNGTVPGLLAPGLKSTGERATAAVVFSGFVSLFMAVLDIAAYLPWDGQNSA
jgi:hypothetical protein